MQKTERNAYLSRLKRELAAAEAVVVGAGSGLSASAGFVYSGPRFQQNFADFIAKYGFEDMYSAGFYPFATPEEKWAYWSRYIFINRYDQPPGQPYLDLLELLQDKDYFVLTTNVDHRFQVAGFDKKRLFYTQGDFGLWQCAAPCHQKTYDNESAVRRMVAEQRDMRVPAELLPRCPICGGPMAMNLRADAAFVEDEGWHAASARYADFLSDCRGRSVLYWELGVGGNTPTIIKFPFWRMTMENPRAAYACVNLGEALAPSQIEDRAILIDADIAQALSQLK